MASGDDDEFERVFGVPRDAEPAAITKAFRARAAQWHPDRNPGDEDARAKFEQLSRLFSEWAEARKKAEPSRPASENASSENAQTPSTGTANANPSANQAPGVAGLEDISATFEQLFRDMFGAGLKPGANRRGRDLQQPLLISEGEARDGVRREVAIVRGVLCPNCKGTGDERSDVASPCAECGGTGSQKIQQGMFQIATTCAKCRGRGRSVEKACTHCREGIVDRREQLTVNVPPGVSTGMKLRLNGKGEDGFGGEPGAFFFDIQVQPAGTIVERDGDALVELPVEGVAAIVGGELTVTTPEGRKQVRVPRFVRDGSRVTFSGEGYRRGEGADPYRKEAGTRGDAIVVFRVAPSGRTARAVGAIALVSTIVGLLFALVR